MKEFRKGDIVKVINYGKTYGAYYKAFKHFNFKDPDKEHSSYGKRDNLENKFRVVGTFMHEYEKKHIMGIEHDDIQLVIGRDGLILLHRGGELNKRIKVL